MQAFASPLLVADSFLAPSPLIPPAQFVCVQASDLIAPCNMSIKIYRKVLKQIFGIVGVAMFLLPQRREVPERNCLSPWTLGLVPLDSFFPELPWTGHWPNASAAYEGHWAERRCEEAAEIPVDEPIDRDTV